MTETESKALEILSRIARREASALVAEHDLVADLGIDSPKALELLCDIEEQCGIEVPDDMFGELDTVGDLLRLVRAGEAQATA